MNFYKFLIVPFLALAVTACGNDCVSTCEDANECAGVTTKADCDAECDKNDKLAEDSDCTDQYDDLTSCFADQDDICKPAADACKAELEAVGKCVLPYCMKNPTVEGCKADS